MLALSQLQPGASAYVTAVFAEDALLRRLLDIGMTPGTRVTCLYAGSRGTLRAYEVRGAVIAVRAVDAARVTMTHQAAGQTSTADSDAAGD